MEDIEDLLVGNGGGGAPPGFRLPLNAVGLNPRKDNNKPKVTKFDHPLASKVPGTQTIYIKTFGCLHNQSDSEYMAGQLSAFGYSLSDNPEEADLWPINAKGQGVVIGNLVCKNSTGAFSMLSLECTVKFPSQSAMDTLITKCKTVKKPFVVAGCVPQGSRDLKEREGVSCVRTVIADGVKEIWLSSEDTGAYGRDIGVNLPILLNALVAAFPPDGSAMLRIGMTNPPFILDHLREIVEVLHHPCVYSFLDVPVQSGSDAVLTAMNREYTVSDFRTVVGNLTALVAGMQIATDIICGYSG
ncbi:hypothetical protein Patl1_07480 [Pistacia atlantica]|uniref:Uncharacterized protein n=1 Tax=Pistacia atlantica TaxID=434234 RepID=A0ACC1AKW9_9ROSI|nr:hypothetical protein Patl1_07480 [Pistacia atlantica]